jgi:hypothetical protein
MIKGPGWPEFRQQDRRCGVSYSLLDIAADTGVDRAIFSAIRLLESGKSFLDFREDSAPKFVVRTWAPTHHRCAVSDRAYSYGMAPKEKQRRRKVPVYQRSLDSQFTNIASNKCTKQAALTYILHGAPVFLAVAPHLPYRAQIQAIANAAVPRIPIVSLSAELERSGSPKGNTFAYKPRNVST